MKATSTHAEHSSIPALLTTAEFAAAQRCAPQTVRKNYCLKGHHHGIKPVKLPSGRLMWRVSDLAAMINEGQ
ncbi:hypothetical protein N234_15920 [Ralstonia pickettii DTP0602]|nr:hypothetical protein N234_15920 [Ralstonia pickettii DTP0602]